jgi:hypothetical protein
LNVNYRASFAATLLALLAISATQSMADNNHYRWIDDRGNPVYSDRAPPKGVDYEIVAPGSGLKRVVDAEEGAVPPEVQPRVGNEFEQVDTAAAQRSKKNPEQCARAHKNLEALTSSDKVKVRNDQGEVRLLTPEEMEVQRQTAKAQISVYCD